MWSLGYALIKSYKTSYFQDFLAHDARHMFQVLNNSLRPTILITF
jgi:hypothetical protein